MRPIECVMDSNSNPTLHALELGSAIGFTKETIIPQKPPPHDNAERWRDAAYSIRHTSQCYSSLPNRPTPGLSLALIGNASEQIFGAKRISIGGVFDKETRRKPLASAVDAVRHGI